MDDRDKDLTHLFVRDLDAIPLPPRAAWRRSQKREHIAMRRSRSLLTAAAVLVLALVVGLQLRDRSGTAGSPSASPRPSPGATAPGAVAPTSGPSASMRATAIPSASAVLNDSFGFLVIEGSSKTLSNETGTAAGTIDGVLYAVSPTGDRIAYVVVGGGRAVVHVRTFADNADRAGPSFGQEDGVTGIAWSGDGTGLLIATGRGVDTGPAPQAPARLQTFDLAGGALTVIATRQDGKVYAPIAWDRTAKAAAAAETGAGGFGTAYLVFDLSRSTVPVKSTPLPGRMSIPRASSDGTLILSQDVDSKEIKYWPLGYIEAMKSIGTATLGALWQPGSHRIGFISGDAFRLFEADDGSFSTPFRGIKGGTAAQPGTQLRAFRADGSAVILALLVGTGAGPTDYTLTRLADGASVTFQASGVLTAAVRLR